jgi:hypothetical protein
MQTKGAAVSLATMSVELAQSMSVATIEITLTVPILIVAAFYAAVGQAGATGYLAVMGLVGLAPGVMKPSALALNILVAAIGSVRFARAGLLQWRSFYPFAVLGAPFSLIGGAVNIPPSYYNPVVGTVLLVAAAQLIRSARSTVRHDLQAPPTPPFLPALVAGAVIGFISGTTGTGGGVFLAPLILLFGWVDTRRTAAVSAAYNLLNSAAALLGTWAAVRGLPTELPWWLAAAGLGGLLGSWLGARHLSPAALRYILASLLLVSGAKMLLTAIQPVL